jgi:hypothetical protein
VSHAFVTNRLSWRRPARDCVGDRRSTRWSAQDDENGAADVLVDRRGPDPFSCRPPDISPAGNGHPTRPPPREPEPEFSITSGSSGSKPPINCRNRRSNSWRFSSGITLPLRHAGSSEPTRQPHHGQTLTLARCLRVGVDEFRALDKEAAVQLEGAPTFGLLDQPLEQGVQPRVGGFATGGPGTTAPSDPVCTA